MIKSYGAQFTVIPNVPAAAVAFVNPAIVTPVAPADFNIYFPADGSQPTTAAAVNYALANVDNRENSPITEWYMKMFGVIPAVPGGGGGVPAVFVQAGWTNPVVPGVPGAQEIVTFPAVPAGLAGDFAPDPAPQQADNNLINNPYATAGAQITKRILFEMEFRKIASTVVGRMLLYRILIEVRRKQLAISNVGVLENIPPTISTPVQINTRNNSRSISIFFGPYFCYGGNDGYMCFFDTNNPQTTVGNRNAGHTNIMMYTKPLSVSLFHEIIHWYHFLRDPGRYKRECNTIGLATFETNTLGYHYWNFPNMTNRVNSESVWLVEGNVDFEELRTVLGVPSTIPNYKQGDDLSENLYRRYTGIPLRFGYSGNIPFYEDNAVIDRVFDTTDDNKFMYHTIGGSVNYLHNTPGGRNGLGNFYITP